MFCCITTSKGSGWLAALSATERGTEWSGLVGRVRVGGGLVRANPVGFGGASLDHGDFFTVVVCGFDARNTGDQGARIRGEGDDGRFAQPGLDADHRLVDVQQVRPAPGRSGGNRC